MFNVVCVEFPARISGRLGSAADDRELQLIESMHSDVNI